MVLATEFTKLIGCEAPIQLAAMGGGPALCAAAANAGALGMLGAVNMPSPVLEHLLAALRAGSPEGKIGVNFLMPFFSLENPDDLARLELAANTADIVEFFYGMPDADLVRRVHDSGALASWQVGSADEARAALDAGCDMIVAQGVEAGGHIRGTTPILALLDQVCAFADMPVLAAGGPGGGAGLATVLDAGAAGQRIGTRFLTASESTAHPDYVTALLRARAEETVCTEAFGVGWPDAPHRVLRSCLEAAQNHPEDVVGTMNRGGQEMAVPKFFVAWPDESATGNVAAMCQFAGESVEGVTQRQSAADIVREIVSEAEALLE